MNESYIAGFFDGEGNVNKFKVKGHTQYQVRIYQAGEKGKTILKEIRDFIGYGQLYLREKTNVWELTITKKNSILDFKRRIGKFCKIKEFPEDKELKDKRLNE